MPVMYPFSEKELAARARAEIQAKRKYEWTKRKLFTDAQLTPRQRQLRADTTRVWLLTLLYPGPRLASEVLKLAKIEHIPVRGLYRAKRHFGITSTRIGGIAYRGKWLWQFPKCAE